MIPASNPARCAVLALTLLASSATRAHSQTGTPQPGAAAKPTGAATPARVEWIPAQPRQGSVVRIVFRSPRTAPPATQLDSTARDTVQAGAVRSALPLAAGDRDSVAKTGMAADTLPSVTVAFRARPDSLRTDSARIPSPPGDSVRVDSLRAVLDTLSLRPAIDSLETGLDSLFPPRATLFGEPLHFHREPSGDYVALGAIPVDAPTAVTLRIVTRHHACFGVCGADTVTAQMPIRRTAYKMEKLTVAPRFGQAPDSALAARIAREQALAAEVSRKSHETPRLWEGEFQRPRAARVTSAFGDGRQFNGRVQSRHMGLDLAGAVGAPVVATNRGVVALVGDFYYAGNAVYIDHGAGLVTAYFHLSAVDVAQGDTVTPGKRIGLVGATGRVTGPHLHWVARYGAVTVDPSTLLEIAPPDSLPKTDARQPRDSSPAARPSSGVTSTPPVPPGDSTARPVVPPPAASSPPPASPPPHPEG